MSSIRLLILGVLLHKQPIHGYDIRRELEQWGADKWANIAYGSIYSALGKMAEEALVEEINPTHTENHAGRTEYIITESGKAEFERLLRQFWWELKPTIDPFQIALTFMDKLSPDELRQALRHRADQLCASMTTLQRILPKQEDRQQPRHIAEGMRLVQAHIETELHWIEEVIRKIECGELP